MTGDQLRAQEDETMNILREMSEDNRAFYRHGAEDALKFRADPYSDLYQDVFRAETAEYKLSVGYDDPNGETVLSVYFKERHKRVKMVFGSDRAAIERAIRFVAEHPSPRPRCWVDY